MERHTLEGWVYILTHPLFPGVIKVGKARNWRRRLISYQTGCPQRQYRFNAIFKVEDVDLAERIAHRRLRGFRIGDGEWFQLSADDAEGYLRATLADVSTGDDDVGEPPEVSLRHPNASGRKRQRR